MTTYPWHLTLWQQLVHNRTRLSHALLLKGMAGTGKRDFAYALAKSYLCEQSTENGIPCGQCTSCHWFELGQHPDFRLLEPEVGEETEGSEDSSPKSPKKRAEISVAQVRALEDFVNLSTHRSGLRVILIHPAESMNTHAANALLKTLEEPPENTLFLLVSHQPQRLLPTVRSRCQSVDMPMPSRTDATKWLESQGVNEPGLSLALAGGAPLAALKIQEGQSSELRKDFLGALAAIHKKSPILAAEHFAKEDMNRLTQWLQQWIYDLASLRLCGQIRHHLDWQKVLQSNADKVNLDQLLEYSREVDEAKRYLRHTLSPQLVLESLLISYSRCMEQTA